MLKDRLAPVLFALLTIALVSGTLLLGGPAKLATAAPLPVLTASAQPPTPTTPSTPTTAPTTGPTAAPTSAPATAEPEPAPEPGEKIADPLVTKEPAQSEVSIGGEISYNILVTNIGNDIAVGVIVEDELPVYLRLLSVSVDKGEAVTNGNTAGLWIGNVAPGEEVRGVITARVVSAPPDGVIVNTAVLRSNNGTDRPNNNLANARVRVVGPIPSPTPLLEGALSPTPTPALLPEGAPSPTPLPLGAQPPAPAGRLPVTAGRTELPLGLLGLLFVVAVGYMLAGTHFWRGPRR